MAGNGLNVEHQAVTEAAGKFTRASQDITSLKAQADSHMHQMRSTWQGMSANAFDAPWSELTNALRNAGMAVQELAGGLEQTAAKYAAEDARHAKY